jgi:hypothetical protein
MAQGSGFINADLGPDPVSKSGPKWPRLLYNTQHVIAAEDYNAVLEQEDLSSQEIRKRTTLAALHSMIDRHHLIDLSRKSNRLQHKWFKKGTTSQSSRIDLILTSIPVNTLKKENLQTIFDHTFLSATLSPAKSTHFPPMNDYVIGSDDFLVRAINTMQEYIALTSHPKHPINNDNNLPMTAPHQMGAWTKTRPSTTTTQDRRPFTPSTPSSAISTISMMKSQRERRTK